MPNQVVKIPEEEENEIQSQSTDSDALDEELEGDEEEEEEEESPGAEEVVEDDEDSIDPESERKRTEALEQLSKIEKGFIDLKEKLYSEKLQGLQKEMDLLASGHHPEFLEQLRLIERKRQERSQVIQTWRDREIDCINTEHDAELMHAENEFNMEKCLLRDRMIAEFKKRLRRLEDEKACVDFSGSHSVEAQIRSSISRKLRRRGIEGPLVDKSGKRRLLTGPLIQISLKESEVNDDLQAIRRATQGPVHRRTPTEPVPVPQRSEVAGQRDQTAVASEVPSLAAEAAVQAPTVPAVPRTASPVYYFPDSPQMNDTNAKDIHEVYIDDGDLVYNKQRFEKGAAVFIENKDSGRYTGTIISAGNGELWVRRTDGSKTKIFVSQLRTGRHVISPKVA